MSKISIIIPVYNVEKLISQCVESVLRQTYNNIEIILVNDGSLDRSGEICDSYAKHDKRVKVIHKENGGQSSARNAGLNIASGEYIGFVDSDDWILKDMYEILMDNLIEYNADVSMCSRIFCFDRSEKEIDNKGVVSFYQGELILEAFLSKDMLAVWNKLFKKELFDNIRFPEGKIHEEIYLTYKILDEINGLVITTEQKYCYYCSESSTVRNKFSMRDLNVIEEWEKVLNEVKLKHPHLVDQTKVRFYISYFDLLNKYVMYGAKDDETLRFIRFIKRKWISELKYNKQLILNNIYLGKNRRIQIKLIMSSFHVFWIFKRFYVIINKNVNS